MRVTSINGSAPSNKTADKSADKDDGNWFPDACERLGVKGIMLHWLTGFRERDCERYAGGYVRPSGYFVRALLRSEQGGTWLAVAMDGSDAQWWRDLEAARRIADAIKREAR